MENRDHNPTIEQSVDMSELKPSDEQISRPAEFIEALRSQGLDGHTFAYQKTIKIAEAVKKAGGRALLIGGFVRDLYFGKISKDIDIEVYGLPLEKMKEVVASQGKVKEVGRAFGVLKVGLGKDIGVDLDVSLPRRDSKIGKGHKGIRADTDPNMSIEEAARRRDFTMNSIAADPLTVEVFDPYGGLKDIRARRLRVTDAKQFSEDPLRVLRALQFTGRFGLELDAESEQVVLDTIALPEFLEQSPERIQEEWQKLLLKSEKPSLGLQLGMRLGVYKKLHPELQALVELPQDPLWHPEGDVWMHTLKVVDAAAEIVKREGLDTGSAFTIMLATLCHDLGKATTTEKKEERYISHGHEEAGREPASKFLESMGIDNLTHDKVVSLVVNHLRPTLLYVDEKVRGVEIKDGTIRRLAQRIYPATVQEVVLVSEADHMGRGPYETSESKAELMLPTDSYPPREWLLKRARELSVEASKPADLTRGKDWITFGFKPGRELGQLIKLGNSLRDDMGYTREQVFQAVGEIEDPQAAIAKLESLLK